MKLDIGENIRRHRRAANLTQTELAEKLGVSDQAVSRWENGSTYPDIELLPVLAGMFDCTLDELMGGVKNEKIKRYYEEWNSLTERSDEIELLRRAFAEFPREFDFGRFLCDRLASEVHMNHDAKSAEELHRVATDILNRCTDNAVVRTDVIELLARGETEERLDDFLERYVPTHDINRSSVLRQRYKVRGESEKYNMVASIGNISAIQSLLLADFEVAAQPRDPKTTLPALRAKLDFLNAMSGISEDARRRHPVCGDGVPDAWFDYRILLGLRISCRLAVIGKEDEALDILEDTTDLHEKFFKNVTVGTVHSYRMDQSKISDITVKEVVSPDGWKRTVDRLSDENKAALEAAHIYAVSLIEQDFSAGEAYEVLANREGWEWFDPIRKHPRYLACMERMKAAGYVGDTEPETDGK